MKAIRNFFKSKATKLKEQKQQQQFEQDIFDEHIFEMSIAMFNTSYEALSKEKQSLVAYAARQQRKILCRNFFL